METVSSKFCTD